MDFNSDGRSSSIFDKIVAKWNSRSGVATRRDPIPVEIGGERKEPKSIQRGNCGHYRMVTVMEMT